MCRFEPSRRYRPSRLATGTTVVRPSTDPARISSSREVGAPPPWVSLPAVVVGGRLGLPVTPLTSPLVDVGPPVMPDTTAVAADEVEFDVVTDVVGVLDVVITVYGVVDDVVVVVVTGVVVVVVVASVVVVVVG